MAAPGARAGGYGPRHFHLREQRVVKATDIRRGHVVLIDGQPCRVMEFTHRTPGNLRAFVQLRLRNLVTGRSEEHTSELQSRSDLVCRLLLEKKKRTHAHPVCHRISRTSLH